MEIRNRTPLVVGWSVQLDQRAAEHLVVAVRGTWAIDERGRLTLLDEQPPLQPADEHVGEPGKSSIRYEADVGPMKPATDCALVGSAVAPRGRARSVNVSFRVGPVGRRARVIGQRRRLFWLLRWWNSPPLPFDRVPLLWELAAGGTDATPKNEKHHSLDLRNPLGRGFRARGSKLPRWGAPLPQILPAGDRKRAPVGFGFTNGSWKHRRPYAGTYDDAWREQRCPLLPDDFDARFHCNAAPGLTTQKHLVGGEPVEVRGCTRSGRLTFKLPRLTLDVRVGFGEELAPEEGEPAPPPDAGEFEPVRMKLVTVTLDADAMRLRLLWRGSLPVHRRFPLAKRIEVAMDGAPS
jgi:hypothetical protein